MPTTLLAVDDSVTMRKALEMTFAGEDFRVVTADSSGAALAMLRSERPAIALVDVTLDGTNGYGLCAKIKADSADTAVILLASKQLPYDAAKGSSARADDFIEKPFDTQMLIDKVRRLLTRASAPHLVPPLGAGIPSVPPSQGISSRPGATPVANQKHTAPGVAAVPGFADASRGGRPYAPISAPPVSAPPPANPTPPTGTPVVAAPAEAPAAHAPPPAPAPVAQVAQVAQVAPAAAAAATLGGALPARLAELGLTQAQIEGVLALSREVVERVVWEVVPVLAETLIKEEIARLTAD